jgi:hypothetical protein
MKGMVAGCDLRVGQHAVHAGGVLGVADGFHARLQQQTRTLRLGCWGHKFGGIGRLQQ